MISFDFVDLPRGVLTFHRSTLTYFVSIEQREARRQTLGRDMSTYKDAAWCTVDYNENIFQAFVVHKRRGKFLILKDNQDGLYENAIIDASNILACEVKK
jgi:hypothetical protein